MVDGSDGIDTTTWSNTLVMLRLPRLLEPPLELLLPPDLPHEARALLALPPALADLQDTDGVVEGEGLGVQLQPSRYASGSLRIPSGTAEAVQKDLCQS